VESIIFMIAKRREGLCMIMGESGSARALKRRDEHLLCIVLANAVHPLIRLLSMCAFAYASQTSAAKVGTFHLSVTFNGTQLQGSPRLVTVAPGLPSRS